MCPLALLFFEKWFGVPCRAFEITGGTKKGGEQPPRFVSGIFKILMVRGEFIEQGSPMTGAFPQAGDKPHSVKIVINVGWDCQ